MMERVYMQTGTSSNSWLFCGGVLCQRILER